MDLTISAKIFASARKKLCRIAGFVALSVIISEIPKIVCAEEASNPLVLTQADLQEGLTVYSRQVVWILQHYHVLHCPPALAGQKISGKVMVAFKLSSNGQLLWAKISQSSGNSMIDQFALQDVRQGKYPPFNIYIPYSSYPFVVPIFVHY